MRFARHSGGVCLILLWSTLAFAQVTAVVTRNTNLRPTPSSTRAPLRLLPPNEVLTLVTITPVNGYYHVHTTKDEDGWVLRTFVRLVAVPYSTGPAAAACGPGTEIIVHPSCPAVGLRSQNQQLVPYPPNSDPGLRNLAKRHVPDPSCAPKPFVLDDARSLQNFVDNTFADARTTKTTFQPTRAGLQHIATFDGAMGEGDLVRLSAYLVIARDEGSESVNCAANDGTDIHISVGPKSVHPTEFDGIVAEMIPQLPRPSGWDSMTLNRLAGKQVLVVGGLTYDNQHFVNDNPANPRAGQPKRFSLWEVHPITEFYVCPSGDGCDPTQLGQWMTLTAWKTAHP
jgi:hypothetical protein